MEYYFDELDPVTFQRIVNAILLARFSEAIRLTPLRGSDGGRDAETAPGNPFFEFDLEASDDTPSSDASAEILARPRQGRYLFQVKHHRTTDRRLTDVRHAVAKDFAEELRTNVLDRKNGNAVNFFFVITNVPASRDSISRVDAERRKQLRRKTNLHADVWWRETVVAFLDMFPQIWTAFPQIFAGGVIPFMATIRRDAESALSRALRIAIDAQFQADKRVKFRQIQLEQSLSRLFVGLDFDARGSSVETLHSLRTSDSNTIALSRAEAGLQRRQLARFPRRMYLTDESEQYGVFSALDFILREQGGSSSQLLLIEGGPGQGKSTLTQMVAQVYRQGIVGQAGAGAEYPRLRPVVQRLAFRIELRLFGEWLLSQTAGSVEQYIASVCSRDSGGSSITADDIHTAVAGSPVLLVFDGLDEVGSDQLRDKVVEELLNAIRRFESGLSADVRAIVTTRPPAMAGRGEMFQDFERVRLAPLTDLRIDEYLSRWLDVQVREPTERSRIRASFDRRRDEPHVKALARNPMQLSVLLQFIRLKGEAFPDRRAELYRDYFEIVIDRDVEKSPALAENRRVIEALHEYLGFKLHSLTEKNQADRTLDRSRLIEMLETWLVSQGHEQAVARDFFRLGEERFGLIVATKGEGAQTSYGFEVQPIQEYFAAAYFSNQVPASGAHEACEQMISRPYWREVASFLAGLRRPNEKVDSVVRARNADRHVESRHGCHGRHLILSLLQEGVFNDPPYAFEEALNCVIDLLDVAEHPLQREPDEFIPSVIALIDGPLGATRQRIQRMLSQYKDCHDPYVLSRLYRVAAHSVNDVAYRRAIEATPVNGRLLARMVVCWPYDSPIDPNRMLSPDVTARASWDFWADSWIEGARTAAKVLPMKFGKDVHANIVDEVALNGSLSYTTQAAPFVMLSGDTHLAVWRLIQLLQATRFAVMSSYQCLDASGGVLDEIRPAVCTESELTYDGLDEATAACVHDMIELLEAVLAEIIDETGRCGQILHTLERSGSHMDRAGLMAWLSVRCVVAALEAAQICHRDQSEWTSSRSLLRSLQENIASFLAPPKLDYYGARDHLERLFRRVLRAEGSPRTSTGMQLLFGLFPLAVRLSDSTECVPVIDMIREWVRHGAPPVPWLGRMVQRARFIRPFIEANPKDLARSLGILGQLRIFGTRTDSPLRVQDTQRILKVARQSDDAEVLRGAASALRVAKFDKIASPGLVCKLLQTAEGSWLSRALFETDQPRRPYERIDRELIESVVDSVLNAPDHFGFRDVALASRFDVLNERHGTSPLDFAQYDALRSE